MDKLTTCNVDVGHHGKARKRLQDEDNIAYESDENSDKTTNDQTAKNNHIDALVNLDKRKIINQNNGDCLEHNVQAKRYNDRNGVDTTVILRNDHYRQSKCSRLQDPLYRKKIIKTLFILWDNMAMGWFYGQMGPTLPDLRLIANASLEQATWLFTGYSAGYLIGCSATGLIGKRLGLEGIVGLNTSVSAFAVVLLPWIPNIIVMVIIRVVIGFCTGGEDTACHSLMFKIWGSDGGVFLQIMHVVFATGGSISPLAAKPFLIEVLDHNPESTVNNSGVNTTSGMSNTTGQTITEIYTQDVSTSHSTTNVQYAYLITGSLLLSSAIPFILICLKTCRDTNDQSDGTHEADKDDEITNISSNIKRTLVFIFLVISFIATSLLDMFPNLLTTFLMSKLNWTQQSSSTITAMFFAAYGIGNFINIFTLLLISVTKLIIISYVFAIIALSCFVYGVFTDHTMLIWVAVPAFSLSLSSILPTLFTWTQSHVTPVTTRVASAFLVSGSLGVMLNPLLTGYLMDNVSLMWFVYISSGASVLCFVSFILALSVLRICTKKTPPDEGITITRL